MNLRAAILALVLSACSSASPEVIRVTGAESGKPMELSVGGRLEVALEGNPTTGYTWLRAEGDSAVLAADGEPKYTPDAAPAGVAGAGGTEVLTFRAVAPGRTRLVLVSRQPWEGGATSDARWEAEVVVRP